MEPDFIEVHGARQHNLRVEHLSIPKKRLVVFTGVSGSGKSSLAFDTLYAEGQRRYVESLSSYARQFLGQMDKPLYERIRGLSPTIAIEQKSASSNPRSTVGTITEIYDYLRVLYARVGTQHCPQCGRKVEALSSQQIVAEVQRVPEPCLLLAPLVENRKGEFRDLLQDLQQRGFVRVRHNGKVLRIEDIGTLSKRLKHTIELVVDRLKPGEDDARRLSDSVETALREGHGTVVLQPVSDGAAPIRLSEVRSCADCGLGLPELSPQSFSFNSPLGMCQACNGLGRRMEMDPDLVVADASLSIRQGAVEPLASIMGRGEGWNYAILLGLQETFGIDLDRPWRELPRSHRDIILRGTNGKRVTVDYQGRNGTGRYDIHWEGVLNAMMRRYSETRSEQMRQYYQKYFCEAPCSLCHGLRLRPESRAVTVDGIDIASFTQLSVSQALERVKAMHLTGNQALIAGEVLKEVRTRLEFLSSVGLGYLSLDRSGPSLSGGEAQRIRLASQLGSELSGVMYVLDEPSIGLHARDNQRLIATLKRLRDAGNSVIVVEHDAETIESADFVVDFGPGAGDRGGHVVFSGTPGELLTSQSLTGQYLSGSARIEVPAKRRRARGEIVIRGASEHNLQNIDVAFPLGALTAVTGVSGAGKSSLVVSILYAALCRKLHGSTTPVGKHRALEGIEQIDKVIHIDQTPIGRTPRSNPATYTKAFDLIREVFASTPEARAYGYTASRFSFNVKGGRCESCEGDGVKRVEMHFLPDVYVPCELCRGKRYNEATLRVTYRGMNIADVLELSVESALEQFAAHPKLTRILQTLADVGLEYVKLGQPATTLSGGEAQRVKLSRELARIDTGRTLYILDEPTTGLHFDDIRKLLVVLNRLVDAGNSVVVIEHNLDVIKCADHIIDMGPEGGDAGGRVAATGTPEMLCGCEASSTGQWLRRVLAS